MSVDNTTKRLFAPLALRCHDEQIVILREQYSIQLRCTVQKFGISKLARSVFVGGKHVNPAKPQTIGDRAWDMMIHVESECRYPEPWALSRSVSSEGWFSLRNSSARSSRL